MTAKRKYYRWSAKINRDTLPTLQTIAGELGFLVETPGGKLGDPSPPAMLDALAAAYRAEPAAVTDALRALGVVAAKSAEPAAE